MLRLTEVGPRDGLQNEKTIIPTEDKVRFVDLLSECGFAEIEVSSFVSPKWVPQLGDAAEVFARIKRKPGVIYSALVPNEKGLEGAIEANVDKIAVFTAASETFSLKNTNATITQTLERFAPVIRKAKTQAWDEGGGGSRPPAGLPVRAYISCVVACPYEGPIAPVKVRDVAVRLLDLGVDEIDLGDTIGVATPDDIERLYDGLRSLLEPAQTTLHLHDTRGTALACAERAWRLGVRSFDSSCAGLGGCPYAPGAKGNVASESLVDLFERLGEPTGADSDGIAQASAFILQRRASSIS